MDVDLMKRKIPKLQVSVQVHGFIW